MAIVIDQATIGGNATVAASSTLAFNTSANVAAGGFIVIAVGWFGSGTTLSSVSGGGLTWTIDLQGSTGVALNDKAALVSAQAPSGLASGTTLTATLSASIGDWILGGFSFTGVATSSPVDVTSAALDATGTTAWTTRSATILAGSVFVGTSFTETANFTSTPTSPSLEVVDRAAGTDVALTAAYRIESSAGSYTVAGTWSSAGVSGTIGVAYKAAPSTDTGPRRFAVGGLSPGAKKALPHRVKWTSNMYVEGTDIPDLVMPPISNP